MTKQEKLRYEYFIETGIVWIDTNDNIEMDYLKWVENKALTIPVVSKRYFLFSGQENGKPTKYLVDDCDDRETAIAKIETEYPNFKWVMTETFNAC
jgi:hypothetical protein